MQRQHNKSRRNDDTNEKQLDILHRCFPCSLPYSAIGTLETFEEDLRFVIAASGVDPDPDSSLLRNIIRSRMNRTSDKRAKVSSSITPA